MTKTSLEVTTEALRMLNVTGVESAAASADQQRAKAHLDAIYAELDDVDGAALEWTVETVPEALFLHAARAVAGSICTTYGKAEYVGLFEAGMRGLRRYEWNQEQREPTRAAYY